MKKLMTFAAIAAIALGAATTFTSCHKGGEEPARDEVKIVTSVAGMTATRAPQLDETGQGVFSNGDNFGLVVKAGGGETKRFDYTVGQTKLYWDELPALADETNEYFFCGVYPDVSEFNADATTFNFNAAAAENPDLLYAYVPGVKKNETVPFKFDHAMHKLVVNLTSNYYSPQELAEAKVQPLVKSTASVRAVGGSVNADQATDDGTPYPVKTGASTTHIVAPQSFAIPDVPMLSITIPGRPAITYKVPDGLTVFGSARVTKLNLALNRDAVSIEGMDVAQWGTEYPYEDTVTVTE